MISACSLPQPGPVLESDEYHRPLKSLSPDVLQHTAQASYFFKALADPTRLAILYMIATQGERRTSSNMLSRCLEISAPTVTHHMKKLLAANLVVREQEGKWAFYSIHEDSVDTVAQIFPAAQHTAVEET